MRHEMPRFLLGILSVVDEIPDSDLPLVPDANMHPHEGLKFFAKKPIFRLFTEDL